MGGARLARKARRTAEATELLARAAAGEQVELAPLSEVELHALGVSYRRLNDARLRRAWRYLPNSERNRLLRGVHARLDSRGLLAPTPLFWHVLGIVRGPLAPGAALVLAARRRPACVLALRDSNRGDTGTTWLYGVAAAGDPRRSMVVRYPGTGTERVDFSVFRGRITGVMNDVLEQTSHPDRYLLVSPAEAEELLLRWALADDEPPGVESTRRIRGYAGDALVRYGEDTPTTHLDLEVHAGALARTRRRQRNGPWTTVDLDRDALRAQLKALLASVWR